tara:strand:- start:2529 stop:2879 length:351 start_codon:yes stop_codon:yes gene_type:complete
MRHQKQGRKFNRDANQRRALKKSQARSLILTGRITTTEAKAKELRPYIEKLVTRAKKDSVFNRRILTVRIGSVAAVKKLIDEVAPKYKDRDGGYTRIAKLPPRQGDGGSIAIIEFV